MPLRLSEIALEDIKKYPRQIGFALMFTIAGWLGDKVWPVFVPDDCHKENVTLTIERDKGYAQRDSLQGKIYILVGELMSEKQHRYDDSVNDKTVDSMLLQVKKPAADKLKKYYEHQH